MRTFICDICKEEIKGQYKEVINNANGVLCFDEQHWDICEKCWGAFINQRRIDLIDFPNKEGKDGEGN